MRWPIRTLDDRFWSLVVKGEKCWEWRGSRRETGYGQFGMHVNGRWTMRRAHRVAYELTHGPVPDGLVVAHRCDNRACVRPSHLVAVTQSANIRDMFSKGRDDNRRRRKTVCKNGHAFDAENTGIANDGRGQPRRYCKACHRTRSREAHRMNVEKNKRARA
jgi:hypothetical protein